MLSQPSAAQNLADMPDSFLTQVEPSPTCMRLLPPVACTINFNGGNLCL